jgi:hypothetical protein
MRTDGDISGQEAADIIAAARRKLEVIGLIEVSQLHLRTGQTYMMEDESCRWFARLIDEAMAEVYGPRQVAA